MCEQDESMEAHRHTHKVTLNHSSLIMSDYHD